MASQGSSSSVAAADHASSADPFDMPNTKNVHLDTLKRWRQAALVLNASRRFRYTLDLKKEEEREQTRKMIRAHTQAIRAALLFRMAGEKLIGSDYNVPEKVKEAGFQICPYELACIVKDRDMKKLNYVHGGVEGIANKLETSTTSGLSTSEKLLRKRKDIYGINRINYSPHFKDFDRPLKEKSTVLVTRDGIMQEISIYGLLPGDVVHLSSGDKITADGLFISGSYDMVIKESSLKRANKMINVNSQNPFLPSGAEVQLGSCKMLVTSPVGLRAKWKKPMANRIRRGDDTGTLRVNFSGVAATFGQIALLLAFGVFLFGLNCDGCLPFSSIRTELPVVVRDTEYNDIIRVLVANLQSSSIEDQKQAAMLIRILTKEDNYSNRLKIARAGAVKPLVSLLSSSDLKLQEHAVTVILNLLLCEENKELIVSSKAIKPLVQVLKTGTSKAKRNTATALFHLSQGEDQYRKMSIGWLGAIPLLVILLGSGDLRGKKDAATALYSLCSVKDNRSRAIHAGIMKPLVKFIADFDLDMMEKSAWVLSILVSSPQAIAALVEEGGILALVKMMEAGWRSLKEITVTILLQICEDCEAYRNMVGCQRELIIPCLVPVSQFNAGGKQKAEALIELLGHP